MLMTIRILVGISLALLVASLATAQDRTWHPHQYALAAAAVTFHVIDWGQTRHIAIEPDHYYEKNPITRRVIGSDPSPVGVDAYMAITGLAFLAAAHYLPTYRSAILTTWGATRAYVVVNNHEIGLRIGGSF